MLTILTDPHAWISLLTLTVMEIVLGIDNIVFLAILTGRLPQARQALARRLGLLLAMIFRLGLLSVISWIMHMSSPLLIVMDQAFSWRDLVLIGGGFFLIYKGTVEIHERIEGDSAADADAVRQPAGLFATLVQVIILDIVFSLDSVITAVGMANHVEIMMAAVVIAVLAMLLAAEPLSTLVNRHPTIKMLALSFLLLIGMVLVADGFGMHVPKGYVYAAMAFSGLVEALNLTVARRHRKH